MHLILTALQSGMPYKVGKMLLKPSSYTCHYTSAKICAVFCVLGIAHTGTCQSNLFHVASVVTALYLWWCLAALTSSRHVKCSKNKVREETTSVWRDTRELPASHTSVCVSMHMWRLSISLDPIYPHGHT